MPCFMAIAVSGFVYLYSLNLISISANVTHIEWPVGTPVSIPLTSAFEAFQIGTIQNIEIYYFAA